MDACNHAVMQSCNSPNTPSGIPGRLTSYENLMVDRKEEKRYISIWRKKMNTVEIKTLLHEGIENIDDKDLLLSIKDLVDEKYVPMDIKKLSPWQIQRIDNAKKQIEQGNFLTNAEAYKVVDE
jgi:hypothetical protein